MSDWKDPSGLKKEGFDLLDLGPSNSTSLLMARLEHASLMEWDHCHFFFIPLFSLSLFVTFLLAYANQNLIFVETKS